VLACGDEQVCITTAGSPSVDCYAAQFTSKTFSYQFGGETGPTSTVTCQLP